MTPLPPWAENLPVLLENDTMTGQCRFRRLKDADYKKLLKALEIAMIALKTYSDNDYARVPAEEARLALAEIEKLGEKE